MPDFGRRPAAGGDPSLNEINRADRFFEALAAKQSPYSTDPAEAELAFLFSGFRDDVRDAPVTAPVSLNDAVEALGGGLGKNRGSRRGFAIVGSVAAAMLCIGGFGTAVYGAGPGDSLYGMRSALFGQQEQTRDDQVSLASAQLQQVQQLIDQGQWEQAQDKLVQVSTAVQGVDGAENKQQLAEQWNALTYKVVEQDPAATLPPGEPLPALPSSPLTWLPVPVVEATTSTSATSDTATSDTTTSDTTTSGTTTSGTTTSGTTTSGTTTNPSETTPTTDPSGTPVPSEAQTPPPVGSSSTSTTSATPPATTPGPSTSPSSSSAPPPARPTTTVTSTAAGTPPTRAPEAAPPSSTSAAPAPSTVVAELPATQPKVTPSVAAPAPAASEPSASAPAATSAAPAQRPSSPATTTVAP